MRNHLVTGLSLPDNKMSVAKKWKLRRVVFEKFKTHLVDKIGGKIARKGPEDIKLFSYLIVRSWTMLYCLSS